MFKYILISSASILPMQAFADITVGTPDSPLKVYGVFDFGVNYSHSGAIDSHDFQSGMDYASRLGLKLNQKLNDDVSLIGNAESWIDLREMELVRKTNFARSLYIGLNSKSYGTLVYGRIMPIVSGATEELFTAPFAPSALGYQAYDLGVGAPTYDFRSSKAISYTTPKFKDIAVSLLYTPNQMVGKGAQVTDAKNYGIMSVYDDGIYHVSASYNELVSNYSIIYQNETLKNIKTKDFRILGQYKINKNLSVIGTAAYIKPNIPDAASAQIYGTVINFEQPKYNFKTAIYRREVDKQDRSAMIYSVGSNYHITKNLDAYIRAEYIANNSNATYTTNSIPLEGAGDDPSTYGVGLKFVF